MQTTAKAFSAVITAAVAAAMATACGYEGDDSDLDLDDVDGASAEEAALHTNTDPNRIVVYSNNIENMIFDWNDLVHDMAEAPLRPDVFLVQQMSGKEDLDQLTAFMSRRLGVEYAGIVAQNHPTDDRFGGQVHPKPKVTTGVIYRKARFDIVNHDRWMPFGRGFKNQPKTCDARSNNSGYETLRVKLHDKKANEDVVVISSRQWTWHACSQKNMEEIMDGFDGGPNDHAGLGRAAALDIIAGDFNDRIFDADGNYRCWYREMNGEIGAGNSNCTHRDLGFTDPLFQSCSGDKQCVKRKAGIDHVFVRRTDGHAARTDHFDVVTFDEAHRASVQQTGGDGPSNTVHRDGFRDAGDRYSGHQARTAYVYYR